MPSRSPQSRIPPGLTEAEARRRLDHFGPNEVASDGARSFLQVVREILSEPMLLLLIAAAGIYLLIGDLAEGLVLSAFAVLTIGLVIYQEERSETALAALKALGAPNARVIRGGRETTIPAREVVPGDAVILDEGERIPADAVLYQSSALVVDESLLTGESVPVRKRRRLAGDAELGDADPGGDDQPYVFSGTLAVQGHGRAEVVFTGQNTRAGQIGVSLASITTEKTRLQQTTGRIVRLFGMLSLFVSAAIIAFYGLVREDWLQGLLSGIALAMAMLPEEFPVALAIFLAIGAWRLTQVKVLARRPAIVEMLGAATVLCVDKTGTLTENRMRIRTLDTIDETLDLAEYDDDMAAPFKELVSVAYLATRRETHDPMDQAVTSLARTALAETDLLHGEWRLVREYGITSELLALSQAWLDDSGGISVATKGAPEAIAELCHLDTSAVEAIMKHVHALAGHGLRVLAVATGANSAETPPERVHDVDFRFLGLVAFEDPVRSTVPAAVAEAMHAGIAVKMITGDYPETARAIADAAGIDHGAGVLTGTRIAAMSNAELRTVVDNVNIYARMMPEQKLRLVTALKDNGEVVAMTGDGVNDAPALKAAHIGIAMGARGTDVAREASGIVLLDEDFGRIVGGVRMGRRIFENLRKVMIYIAAVHIPIAGLALLPLIAGMPPLFFPLHIVLTEMVIDPVSSIAFETTPEEPDIMDHPPRPASDLLVGVPQLALGFLQGGILLAICLAIYWGGLRLGYSVDQARALTFIGLTAGNLGLVRINTSHRLTFFRLFDRGYALYWAIAAAATLIVGLAVTVPAFGELFAFALPDGPAIAVAIALSLAGVVLADFIKLFPAVQRIMGKVPNHKTRVA